MPSFIPGGGDSAPFGKNQYLYSTVGQKIDPVTIAASTVATETIDGTPTKVLQSGEVIAKITSGGDAGKFGPYDASAADGRQTAANIVGVNDTYVPWQLNRRDVEVGITYAGTLSQSKCFERTAGVRGALGDTTAALLVAKKTLDITFR